MARAADRRCQRQRDGMVCKCATGMTTYLSGLAHKYKVCRATLAAWMAERRCQCCLGPLGKSWVVDHCHSTGFARGVVCRRCNIALAYIENEPLMRRGLSYLGTMPRDSPYWERPPKRPPRGHKLVGRVGLEPTPSGL